MNSPPARLSIPELILVLLLSLALMTAFFAVLSATQDNGHMPSLAGVVFVVFSMATIASLRVVAPLALLAILLSVFKGRKFSGRLCLVILIYILMIITGWLCQMPS